MSVITAIIVSVTVGSEPSGRAAAEEAGKKALGELVGYPAKGEQGTPHRKSSSENDLSRYPSGQESAAKGVSGGQRGEEAKEQPASGPSPNTPPETPETQPQTAQKPCSDLRPESRSEPNPTADLRPEAHRQGMPEPNTEPEPNSGQRTLPGAQGNNWASPTQREIEAANAPRHYELLPGAIMALTIG